MNKLSIKIEKQFLWLKEHWESPLIHRLISNFLIITFLGGILISVFHYLGWIEWSSYYPYTHNPFFAIDLSFNLLMLFELVGLIFAIPASVSKSLGKQFELLSLIFLRDAFKEFSHIQHYRLEELLPLISHVFIYAFGSLVLFIIIGFINKLQKHVKICFTDLEQNKFIRAKRNIAVMLMFSFVVLLGFSFWGFITHSWKENVLFSSFYTVLIFSDILIVLIALRYTVSYLRIFRFSAYVLATIFIRIALSVEVYYNVLIGIVAALFVLILAWSFNYFIEKSTAKGLKRVIFDHSKM